MATLKEEALAYEPKQLSKNIADLDKVSVELVMRDEDNVDFPYKFIELSGERYRVPNSVLEQLKAILKVKPDMTEFKVTKAGTGLNTNYTVIPL